jgi:hypothetical protein
MVGVGLGGIGCGAVVGGGGSLDAIWVVGALCRSRVISFAIMSR